MRQLGGRATWVFADQGLSSLSNAALMIVVARSVSSAEYGSFALAFSAYAFVLALAQALPGQIMAIRHADPDDEESLPAAKSALGLAALIGVAGSMVMIVIALFLSRSVKEALITVAVLLPAMMVQELWRVIFVSWGTPRKAFFNDLVWVVLQAVFLAGAIASPYEGSWVYLLAWGGAAVLAGLCGCLQGGFRPEFREAISWNRRHRDIGFPSVANAFTILGAVQVALIGVASVASVQVVGALRAVQTLLGPLNIFGFALSAFAVPEIARRRQSSFRQYILFAVAIGAPIVALALGWGGVLIALPDRYGPTLLGDTWEQADKAIPGMMLYFAAIGATTGATAVMRALGRASYAFWTSCTLAPLIIIGAIGGAAWNGAAGSAWGYAAASALNIPICWWLLLRAARKGPIVTTQPETTVA
jgi:O-antigen/teichoic acid export membrane protein